MSIISEVACFLLLVYLVRSLLGWLIRKRQALSTFQKAGIPGPKPSFWTGNSREYIRTYHEALDKWCKQYGSTFGYFFSDTPVLLLSDVDDVLELTVKMGKAFPNRQKPIVSIEPFASSLLETRG